MTGVASSGLSLKARLLAGVGLVAAVLLVVAVAVTFSIRAELIDQIDARLATASSGDRGRAFDRDDPDDHPKPSPPPGSGFERQSDLYEGEIERDGTVTTFYAPNLGGQRAVGIPEIDVATVGFTRNSRSFRTVDSSNGGGNYRVLIEARDNGSVASITGTSLSGVEQTMNRLVVIELIGAGVALAVLGLVTWWVLRLGIAPIKQMTHTATTIAGGDLSARADEGSSAAESRELAVALNTMMGTIQNGIAEQAASEARVRRFVSDASHELRTPVTTIRGYAQLYQAGGLRSPGELEDAMRRTEQESARMARLVEDMLTLAKLDEQRPIERRPVDLAQVAADAVADAAVLAPDRPITLDAPDAAVVVGDEDRLRQVVSNLVNNALAHTEAGAPITIRVSPSADSVALAVVDRGAGLPADVAQRITERFFRADPSRSRARGGSGLGLSIVDSTVTAHDGSVTVDSEPGVGTTVTVELPTG